MEWVSTRGLLCWYTAHLLPWRVLLLKPISFCTFFLRISCSILLFFLVCFYSNCCIKVNLSFQMRDLAVISDIFATNFVSWNYQTKKLSTPKSSLKALDQRCDICKGIDRKMESSYIWGSKSFHLFSFFLLLTHWWMEGSSSQKFDWKLFFDMMLFTVLSHYVLVDI